MFFSQLAEPHVTQMARFVLAAFVLTFILTRTLVYLMNSGKMHNIFFQVKGTHVHHLNYGIFMLAGVGGYLVFSGVDSGLGLDLAATAYGVGMALTFDEFGMWLHLEDNYWQRASWDAMLLITSLFGLVAFAPSIYDFRPGHWVIAGVIAAAVTGYVFVFIKDLRFRMEEDRAPADR